MGGVTPARRLALLDAEVASCRACPRLVRWREDVAAERRKAYASETYWGRAVPGFGPADARVVVVGLAPAAHGANRTGRMFTGDESGRWLFRALHHAGLASQESSTHRDDGLVLHGVRITASAHCAPPDNKPTPAELRRCAPFLTREFAILSQARVVLCLGKVGWDAYLGHLASTGVPVPRPRPRFSHGAEVAAGLPHVLLGSYHPSQQNTFTKRLTEPMLDAVMARARALAGL